MESKTKIVLAVIVVILAIVIGLLASSFRRLSSEEGNMMRPSYFYLKFLEIGLNKHWFALPTLWCACVHK